MNRNRIQHFLAPLPDAEPTPAPQSSLVLVPPALWAELRDSTRAQLAQMYARAFRDADAHVRRNCVEQLLESIATR